MGADQTKEATAPVRSKEQVPQPGPGHKRLHVFVGNWNTEGEAKLDPAGPALRIKGTDSYEWLPGEFFLIHRWDVRIGEEQTSGIEIIGYDDASDTYPMQSFDNQGRTDILTGSVKQGEWTYEGQSGVKTIRCTLAFSDADNTITGKWEQSGDGTTWIPWMNVKLARVTG